MVDPSGRVDATGQPLILGTELVVDSDEDQFVRQIFERFAAGISMRAIAHRLNAEAVAFPAAGTRHGTKRKGWAQSAVRVILRNEKYRGQWIFGRRIFFKDPVSGRRRARPRPTNEWQLSEHPDLRIIPEALWQVVQARFAQLARVHLLRQKDGRLAGRGAGSPWSRGTTLFSGLLHCQPCGGGMVVVSGGREQANRRDGRSARDPRCGGPTALLREPDDIVIAGLNGIDAMAEVTARPRRLAIESSSRHDATQREA